MAARSFAHLYTNEQFLLDLLLTKCPRTVWTLQILLGGNVPTILSTCPSLWVSQMLFLIYQLLRFEMLSYSLIAFVDM